MVMSYTYGHHHGVREFDEAVEILAAHPELADAMITHRFPLDDAPEAFRVAGDRAAGAIKVVIATVSAPARSTRCRSASSRCSRSSTARRRYRPTGAYRTGPAGPEGRRRRRLGAAPGPPRRRDGRVRVRRLPRPRRRRSRDPGRRRHRRGSRPAVWTRRGSAPRRASRRVGVEPGDVTDVLFTHLHFDHIGWASTDGVPTFPNATYRCDRRDWDHFVGSDDVATARLRPVEDRFEPWDGDASIAPGVDARLCAGHTPGSALDRAVVG